MRHPFFTLMRLKPTCLNLDGFEQSFRRSLSLSRGLSDNRRPWTAEETDKLVDLYQKGVPTTHIAKQLNRNIIAVKDQRAAVMRGKPEPSSREPWTAEEDATLLAKRQAGCNLKDINLPGRSKAALLERWRHYLDPERTAHTAKPRRSYTAADVERIIDLRVNQRKSVQEVAVEFQTSQKSIAMVWYKRCKHLIPKEVLHGLRSSIAWTSKQDDFLIELYNKGRSLQEINTHFPNKTHNALKQRLFALSNSLKYRQATSSPAQRESLKRTLEPYIGVPFTGAELKFIRELFPMFSAPAINSTLRRMRRGEASPQLLPILDGVKAEERISRRRSR